MGLKLGIYLNNGKWTCQHYAGSEGYLTQDVETIASWDVDGLKLDGCYMTMNTFKRVNDSYEKLPWPYPPPVMGSSARHQGLLRVR